MPRLQKVRRDQPFRPQAADWNAFIDAANRNRGDRPPPQFAGGSSQVLILVRNDSGDDRSRFDVLGLEGVVIEPDDNEAEFKNRICMKGVEPTAADHRGRFVVLQEPVPDGKIGVGLLAGATPCHVDIQDANHRYCDIYPGEFDRLKSGEGESRILWSDDGTGSKWAIVLLGDGPRDRIGILEDDLHPRSVATVSIYAGEPGDEVDTGEDWECWDWMLTGSGNLIEAGTHVAVRVMNGYPYVIAAGCSPP